VADHQQHVLHVRQPAGVELRLHDASVPVDLPAGAELRLRPLAGRGAVVRTVRSPFEQLILVDEPGPYALELPKLPGYREPVPRLLEFEGGRIQELVVALEREHP
jgi:hypothetical protein